jgi:hypothetical protein
MSWQRLGRTRGVNGQQEVRCGGQQSSRLMDNRTPVWRTVDLPERCLGEGLHPLAGEGFGETRRRSLGDHDVGVM